MTNKNVTLSIPEMHCESCPKLVKLTLMDINGVDGVWASLDTKTIEVNFDPQKTSIDSLISSIAEIGYVANIK